MATEEFSAALSAIKISTERERLDGFLACCFPQFSRAQLQQWIKQGQVLVNQQAVKPSLSLHGGEEINIKGEFPAVVADKPQQLDLDIAYEDDNLFIINKPVGLVVHPGAGNPDNTLLNALLAYRHEQEQLPRAGLVHRLDRGTSGLIIAAKHPASYNYLQRLLKERKIKRNYLAVVEGVPVSGGMVDTPISRDPHNRLRKITYKASLPDGDLPAGARHAITHFRVAKKFISHSLLNLSLETGRTHQLRVHLQSLGYPLVGDRLYGWQKKLPPSPEMELTNLIRGFSNPVLHAISLEFMMGWRGMNSSGGHGQDIKGPYEVKLEAPVPAKMNKLLELLSQHTKSYKK